MANTLRTSLFFLAVSFAADLALADIRMEPGLWEMTKEAQSTSGAMEKELADLAKVPQMPAEQREAMMSTLAQQGIRFGADGKPRFMSCVNEATAKQFPLADKNQQGCQSTVKQNSETVMEVSTACSDANNTANMDVVFTGKRNFTMTAVTTQKKEDGTTERITIKSTGSWVAPSCHGVSTSK